MATSAQITRLLPRHIEIMNRLLLGQKESDIARDLGMSISRVSIIVNSPLFQLELKRQLRKRQNRILNIEDTIIEASEVGANLMKSTLTNPNVPLPIRVEVSNKLLTHLFGRIVRQMPAVEGEDVTDPDNLPYEKKLEREIRVKETTYYRPQNDSQNELDSGLPPDDVLDQEWEEGEESLIGDDDDVDLPFDDSLLDDATTNGDDGDNNVD